MTNRSKYGAGKQAQSSASHRACGVNGSSFFDHVSLSKSRKAEGTIIANLIIFVAVMAMAAATVALFKTLIDESTNAAADQNQQTVSVMRTDFTISSATYNSGTIYIYAKNTGKQQLDPNDLDIYIDSVRIPRDVLNRTVQVTSDTDTINTGIWDEKEELEFDVFLTYATPQTHTVRIEAPNGVSADSSFSS